MVNRLPYIIAAAFIFYVEAVFLLSAQDNRAILIKFQHQSPAPIAYPNYFGDRDWTDSLLLQLDAWMQDRFKVSGLDYKKVQPISFVPSSGGELAPKSIAQTNYLLGVYLITSLESAFDNDRNKKGQGRLICQIWVQDGKGRNVFKNKTALNFKVDLNDKIINDVYLSSPDFKLLFNDAFQLLLKKSFPRKDYLFTQGANEDYQAFMKGAAHDLEFQNQGEFHLKGEDADFSFNIRLLAPTGHHNNYYRDAVMKHPIKGRDQKFISILDLTRPYKVDLGLRLDSTTKPGVFTYEESREEYLVQGEYDADLWELRLNKQKNFFKIIKNRDLWALGVYQDGIHQQNAKYKVYFREGLEAEEKTWLANLLGLELLSLSARRYYEIESNK